jgi:NAD(P)-dependent dehydrogenase (short-subunit alcohol dehydrogenase family)
MNSINGVDDLDFTGRRVIVTGAAWTGEHAGIGRATALAFAARGADLVLVDRNKAGLDRTIEEVTALGATCRPVVCDVTDRQAIFDAVGPCAADGVDVLASVAGITSFRPLVSMTESDVRAEVDLNLLSHVWMSQLVLPGMSERRDGSIVLVGSDSARYGNALLTMYCASKGGVMSLTRALAAEVGGDGVRVNCVSPGRTDSASRRMHAEHLRSGDLETVPPIGRIGQPPEIASLILFLASPLASYITGQIVSANGGLHRF